MAKELIKILVNDSPLYFIREAILTNM